MELSLPETFTEVRVNQRQLLTYISKAGLDKPPRGVTYQVLKKSALSSPGAAGIQNPPGIATTKASLRSRGEDRLGARPASVGLEPRWAHWPSRRKHPSSNPEPWPACRTPSSTLPPTPRPLRAWHSTPSRPTHLLSTHCLHRIAASGSAGGNGPLPEKPKGQYRG